MNNSRRGAFLTAISILLVLLAVTDILKPFRLEGPTTGLVFFGTRLSGVLDAIIAPLFGLFLLYYASTIWRMRSMAQTISFAYAIYVTFNLAAFTLEYPRPTERSDQIFGIAYLILALALTWSTAIYLSRRKADLT